MSCYRAKMLATTCDDALTRTTQALKAEGFGVITQIDMRDTLKRKIDANLRFYPILGACDPALAFEALKLKDKVGTMLPATSLSKNSGLVRSKWPRSILSPRWTERPEIDAWIVWTIWQVANPSLADLVEVEPEFRIYRDTGVGLTRQGRGNPAAKEFVTFLQSSRAAAVFCRWGWIAGSP